MLSSSISAFSQDSCDLRVRQLRERLADAREQLRICESGNSGRGEVEQLRNENLRLRELNRRLQQRLEQYEGRPSDAQFYCSAGCISVSGTIDNRYITSGTAYTELEADMLAKQSTQRAYSCNYGVKTYKCEPMFATEPRNFCTAACISVSGTPDQRYLVGARGRNVTEAEVTALQEVQKKYSCNYGVRIIECR
jgi:hypothetical protein